MTQEEKQLLLVDLCARVMHGVMVQYHYKRGDYGIDENRELDFGDVETLKYVNEYPQDDWCEISWKPYLRPMSSITKEEKEELRLEHEKDERLFLECINKSKNGDNSMRGKVITHYAADWCNENHFDYRGLIEKGLALEAPKEMYNTKP